MKILSKIPFEKGIDSISLNPEENQAFVSENHADSISQIDFDTKTKSKICKIERPRDFLFEPDSNRIYSIYGKTGFFLRGTGRKIGIIDVDSKKIIKEIGEKEGFAGISRNSKTKKIYVTQPSKKLVWVIDEQTLEVEDKIDVKGKYGQIIVNENNQDLILGKFFRQWSEKFNLDTYNFESKKIEHIFSGHKYSLGEKEFVIKFFPIIDKIIIQFASGGDEIVSHSSGIIIIDYKNNESSQTINPKSHRHRIRQDFDMDTSNDFLYYRETDGKEGKENLVKRSLKLNSEEINDLDLKFEFDEHYGSYFPSVFRIHPKTGNFLILGREKVLGKWNLIELSI